MESYSYFAVENEIQITFNFRLLVTSYLVIENIWSAKLGFLADRR